MQCPLLHQDPQTNAKMMCDQHIVKLPTEVAQVLCTTRWRHARTEKEKQTIPYKATHPHHPFTHYALKAQNAYLHLAKMGLAMLKEYSYRFNKPVSAHKSWSVITDCINHTPPHLPLTNPPPYPIVIRKQFRQTVLEGISQVISTEKKTEPITAYYRLYYLLLAQDWYTEPKKNGRTIPMRYTGRTPPAWLNQEFLELNNNLQGDET